MEFAKLIWSDEYLVYIEENFETIFDQIYKKDFIDNIFATYETRIGKNEFVEMIAGGINDRHSPLSWVFKPSLLRQKM